MAQWVRLCAAHEAPVPGGVVEAEANGVAICLANVEGTLSAMDNWCPHRRGPMGQGWVEGRTVVCPWHCWAFDVKTGVALPPEQAKIAVIPVRIEGDDVLVDIG